MLCELKKKKDLTGEGDKYIHYAGLLIFRGKKKQNFAGFSGANSRKNWPISREKNQNSRIIRLISRDFSGKKSNFEGFSGADFTGNFGGKLCQEPISKKQPILLDFFFGKFR